MSISRMLKKPSLTLFLAALVSSAGGQNKPPVCNQTYVSTSIMEGVPVGTKVLNFRDYCSDPENGPLRYQLNDNANQQFTAPASENLLKTNKPADAEAVLSYARSFLASPWTLRVTIRDNANAACIFTVFVNIISINDNPATIKDMVIPPVRENTYVGTIIGGCNLVDGDYPKSGHDIPFVEIIGGNEDKKFGIDYKTCDISLLSPLDYETKVSYTLTFRAYNFPNDPKATTKQQTIAVVDVNDNSPTCRSYNIIKDITEDKLANDVLLKLDCWDVDSVNNAIDFFIVAQGNNYPLKVDQKSGEILTTKDLDYDLDLANRNMDITVRVTDTGNPPKSTTATAAIRMLDVDDQPPEFTQRIYSAILLETADLGQFVLTLSATDNDTPHTALSRITFGLETPCSQDWFIIDRYTGVILVKSFLDWETEPIVSCLVYAYSSDKFEHRTYANVSITITDVNDRSPQFTKYLFEGMVVENSPAFTSVLTVTARDPEDGVNGQFMYTLPEDSPFAIDEITGLIYVKDFGVVDYETAADYNLLVAAIDKGTPTLTSYSRIHITVEPVNECTPVFTNLSDQYVSELTWPGTLLTTIHVHDCDAEDDGTIEYILEDSTSTFILRNETGELFVGIGLDYEVAQSYTLLVTVVDKSKTMVKSSTDTFKVIVINENENDPKCQNVQPIIITPSSHTVGDTLCQLNCTDLDLNTVLRFVSLRGNSSVFEIHSNIGTVTMKALPAAGSHLLVISVSDQDTPARMTEVFVQINVETTLKFTNIPERTSISEDAGITSLVYTISTVGAYENIIYEITKGNHDGSFILHHTKGELRLVKPLDRETTSTYAVTIMATTGNGQTAHDVLIIDVDDINDNPPMYNSSFDYIRVSEIQSVPSTLKQFTATDGDILKYAEIDYSILYGDPGNLFKYTSAGELQLVKQLDYEMNSIHTLTLCATDRGDPKRSGTMLVNVEVVDEDDNNFKIDSSGGIISLTIPEDVAVGEPIITIQVQNNDTSSDLTFTITSGNSGNNFTIDERTGVLTLIFVLDRESASSLILGIRLVSSSGKIDTATLYVTITDVNDNNPVFNSVNYVFSVPHGTSTGSTIGSLSVTDLDTGVNKDFSLSITSGDPNNVFRLSGTTLIAASLLDANVNNHYQLQITARDHGIPSLNATTHVRVLIQQELKTPKFSSGVDEITIEETCLPGTALYDANGTYRGATERSLDHSGDLVYSLGQGESDTFYVDPDNGQVRLIGPLRFSLKTSHTLTITAANVVNTSLIDNLTLTVKVVQVNMYDPVFNENIIILNASEKTVVRTVVGQVTATDNDTGQFGNLRYSIESNDHFYISPSTGIITLIRALEYSTAKVHYLLVKATDNAGVKSRSATILVCIFVIDTNNNSPIFKNTPYIVQVSESLPVGSVIHVVVAKDLDSGVKGTVSYSIVSGNWDGKFTLNSRTGELIISSNLDFERSRIHILTIQGQDGGMPSLSTNVTVTVYVADEIDNPPRFDENSTDLLIERESPAMTYVFQVSASGKDSAKNTKVRYTIQGGNNDLLFLIDTLRGLITTARTLTHADNFHTLIIGAFYQGLPHLSATMTINIALTPMRNVTAGDCTFEVRENENVGTLVGSIVSDPTLHAIRRYSIIGGNYGRAYIIRMNDNKEGILLTNTVLDREAYPYYKLHVAVEYASGIKYIDVVVCVLDVNDNPPVFESSTLQIYMVENLPPGNTVGTLTITDADEEGTNSEWDLSISPPSSIGSIHFSVEASGVIKVVKSVSYEKFHLVKFYVVAADRCKPQLLSTATVIVKVVDVFESVEYMNTPTASYISREFPDDATEEELCTLKASHAGLSPGPGDVVKFITAGVDSVFRVQDRTNAVIVHRPSFIFTTARYFQPVVALMSSPGIKTTRALLIRLDTFNKDQNMIVVVVDMDLSDLRSRIETLRSELQTFFQWPQAVRIWKTQTTQQQGGRRLLNSGSEALIVVVEDDAADDMSNILMAKTFLPNTEAVKPLQASPDGTPVQRLATSSVPVISVLPSSHSNSTESIDELDPAFVAVIIMGCIASVVLTIGLIAVIAYCVCYRRSEKRDDKEGLVTGSDTESRKVSFQTIANSEGTSRASNESSISSVLLKTSVVNVSNSGSTLEVRTVTRSHSMTGGQPASRQRKITPVNEPGLDRTGFLEVPSVSPSSNSMLDDSHSDVSSKATSIIVSSYEESLRAPSTIPSRRSSTMLESLEVDVFNSPQNV